MKNVVLRGLKTALYWPKLGFVFGSNTGR